MSISSRVLYIAATVCFALGFMGVGGNWNGAGLTLLAAGHIAG